MNIPLSPQQQQMLDNRGDDFLRVIDPRTNDAYVLAPESDYEAVREIVEDERRRQAIHQSALRNAAGRIDDEP
jgi:hypothetical protein